MTNREDYERNRAERKRLKQEYAAQYAWLTRLFARHDPVRLVAVGAPPDEYEPEVDTILPRLKALERAGEWTEAAILPVLHEEFVRWFSPGIAGPAEGYRALAQEIAGVALSGLTLPH